jgi:hypothetical protein
MSAAPHYFIAPEFFRTLNTTFSRRRKFCYAPISGNSHEALGEQLIDNF